MAVVDLPALAEAESLDESAADPRTLRFGALCRRHDLTYAGRPLRAVPYEWLQAEPLPEGRAFSARLVASYLALQRRIYSASARVRSWIDACCTEWGRRLNHASLELSSAPHLFCRGDEIMTEGGDTFWAEQEVDDGGLGPDSAMELVFLGTTHLMSSYVRAFESVGWHGDRPLVIVVGASYSIYLPWMRFLARSAAAATGKDARVMFEGDQTFERDLEEAMRAGALFHNFFECYRHDRFLNDRWNRLLESWCEGRVSMWPAPAIFHEWKAWPAVFHDPGLLEDDARRALETHPDVPSIRAHLPGTSLLAHVNLEEILSNRACLFFKPAFGGGSYGVRAGSDSSALHLRQMLRKAPTPYHYVVQKQIPSRRVRGLYMKISPHYFFGPASPEHLVASVMVRPSPVVHGQKDGRVAVVTLESNGVS